MKEKDNAPKKSHSNLLIKIKECFSKFEELRGYFDLSQKEAEFNAINTELSTPDIWKDQNKFQSLQQNKKRLERNIQFLSSLYREKEDLEVLEELAGEGENVDEEISQSLASFEKNLEEAKLQTLFFEEDDARNAILTIHPGAGGTESQDWAQILLRMYLRYAERKGFKADILDFLAGEEAGLKSVTVRIQGDYVFGNLSQESGVHRLVRISPFDANKRRHTSFAAVFVYPEVEEDIEVKINPEDLRIDTYRASGRGGQHVNVTDSAVRITHIPTNIVVQCQSERSQHKNKASAMKVLKARIYELEKKVKREKLEKLEDAKSDIAWGNQIRSYVLQPYRMIKDLRTNVEIGDVDRVLDGDIDEFIKSNLIARKSGTNKPHKA
ncbi:MAG: peptide chain release factor 2 [Candidatus Aminicenantes bacterium]|nr:peptide chain release factor 2 [Candidatus Aminicenantes bacterium]